MNQELEKAVKIVSAIHRKMKYPPRIENNPDCIGEVLNAEAFVVYRFGKNLFSKKRVEYGKVEYIYEHAKLGYNDKRNNLIKRLEEFGELERVPITSHSGFIRPKGKVGTLMLRKMCTGELKGYKTINPLLELDGDEMLARISAEMLGNS